MYNKMDIMAPFFEAQEKKYSIREIARLLKISPMTARKHLNELAKDGLLKKEKQKLFDEFSANEKNHFFIWESKNHFAKKIIESGLLEFLDKSLHIPRAIILFGSCSKGEVLQNSDIDLFILSDTKKTLNLKSFEKKLKREIHSLIYTKKDLEKLKTKNKELLTNILNGVILKGYLEVFE